MALGSMTGGSMGGTALGAAGTGMLTRPARTPAVMGTQPAPAATNPMAGGTSPLSSAPTQPMGGTGGWRSAQPPGTAAPGQPFGTMNAPGAMQNSHLWGKSDWGGGTGPTGQQLLSQMNTMKDRNEQFAFFDRYAGKGQGGNDLQQLFENQLGGPENRARWINDTGYGGGNAYSGPIATPWGFSDDPNLGGYNSGQSSGSSAPGGAAGAGYGPMAAPPWAGEQQGEQMQNNNMRHQISPEEAGRMRAQYGGGGNNAVTGGPGDQFSPMAKQNGGPGQNYDMMQRLGPRQGPGQNPVMGQPQGGQGQPPMGQGPNFQGGTPMGGQGDLAQGGYNMGEGGPIQSGAKGGNYYNDQARQAYMDQSRRQLDPQWQQSRSDMESKLTNMGLARGSAAWEREAANMSRSQNDAYDMAGRNAILTGGQEGSRMQGMDIGAMNANNQAQQQGWNQRYGQAGLNMQGRGLDLQGRGQEMDYGLRSRQLGNQEQQQDFNNIRDLRRMPYEEQNLAIGGFSPNSPQFSTYTPYNPGSQNSQNYSGQIQNANNQQAAGNNSIANSVGGFFGGLFG